MKRFANLKFLFLSLLFLSAVNTQAECCVAGAACDTCSCNYIFRGEPVWCDSSTSIQGCCGDSSDDATQNCQIYCCSSAKCQAALASQYLPSSTLVIGSCSGIWCSSGTSASCPGTTASKPTEKMQNKQEALKKSKQR